MPHETRSNHSRAKTLGSDLKLNSTNKPIVDSFTEANLNDQNLPSDEEEDDRRFKINDNIFTKGKRNPYGSRLLLMDRNNLFPRSKTMLKPIPAHVRMH